MDMPVFIKLSKTTDNTKDEFYVNINKILKLGTATTDGVNHNYIIIENHGTQFIDQEPEEIITLLRKVWG